MNRLKTIKELKRFFKEKDENGEFKLIPENELKGYMDSCNVLMIIPLTEQGKDLLLNNFELGEPHKIPEFNYFVESEKVISGYSIEYLNKILEFIKVFKDFEQSVKIEIKKDYPMTITLKHFKIVLAPRVEN